jgi:hypothetical protein
MSDIKARLSRYQDRKLALDLELSHFLTEMDTYFIKILNERDKIQAILDIKSITLTEFQQLKRIITNLSEIFGHIKNLFDSNKSFFTVLEDIEKTSKKLIEEIPIITDLDTSWENSGDYIWDIHRDKLFAIDEIRLEKLLNLFDLCLQSTESPISIQFDSKLLESIVQMTRIFGNLSSDYVPSIVYRKIPSSLSKLIAAKNDFQKNFQVYSRVVINEFFELTIEKANEDLDMLRQKIIDETYADKPIKLKGIFGIKKDYENIFYLLERLDWVFSSVQ